MKTWAAASQVRTFIVAAALAAAPRAAATQESDKLETRLRRMTECVDDFVQRIVNVVAEERYEQRVTQPHRRRQLLSDFLLVRSQSSVDLFQFRDVLEVDGKPVRGRDEGITRLFLQPWETAFRQATAIARESAATKGQAWIHEQTSCVMKTELRLRAASLGPRLVTSFAYDDVLRLNVPVKMRVRLPSRLSGEMQGTATYGRFQVQTTETIRPQ